MQEKLIRQEQEDEAEMSIDEISSPIAQHILDFCDDGGGGNLYPIGGPSPAVSSTDVAGSSTTTDVIPPTDDLISAALSSFPSIDDVDLATIDALLDSQPQPQPQPQLQTQTQQQQQSVPSINFNNFLPQLLNSSDFSPKEDNQTKALEDVCNVPASQFLMRAPSTSVIQVGPMQIQRQGGRLMGIENNLFPLQMIQQNNTDRQRFFHSGNSSNGLAIPELGGMTSHLDSEISREQIIRRIFSPGDIQVIRGSQNIMTGCNENNATPVLASTEPTAAALEESSSYKVGRLTQEERKAKIDRYIRKRNERNFKKKIKYACRKTLADSRPRVRGRFAKNDEFEEPIRRTYSNGAYDIDEGTSPMVPVKEHEDVHDSSDILAHITNYNSPWSSDTWSV